MNIRVFNLEHSSHPFQKNRTPMNGICAFRRLFSVKKQENNRQGTKKRYYTLRLRKMPLFLTLIPLPRDIPP
jgi:hypothetical protein